MRAATLTLIAASTALVGYCVYFDYTRRTSPEFRTKLRKNTKKTIKSKVKDEEKDKKAKYEDIKAKLSASLVEEPVPEEMDQKQPFFISQVAKGEQLALSPDTELDAAICFYKALSIYPNPTDILGIYQRSVPEAVYQLIVMMIAIQPPQALANVLGEKTVSQSDVMGIDEDI